MKTIVYVDGFNLYYGCLKNTPYRWLNLLTLSQNLLKTSTIVEIKYFTARVVARSHDPQQPNRQDLYLRALQTIPNLSIIFGQFLAHKVRMPLAHPPNKGAKTVEVIKTEEKGSDVNLATAMLVDGFEGKYELAVVVSNDSDLYAPIDAVVNRLRLKVGLLNPHPKPSQQLRKTATFIKPIREGVLRASQFSDQLTDTNGTFTKPPTW